MHGLLIGRAEPLLGDWIWLPRAYRPVYVPQAILLQKRYTLQELSEILQSASFTASNLLSEGEGERYSQAANPAGRSGNTLRVFASTLREFSKGESSSRAGMRIID